MKKITVVLVCCWLLLFVTACTNENKREYDRVEVSLEKSIDGDTISVLYNGEKENIRFLLVDTPETSHPRLGEQPFGQEAKEFTKNLVEKANKIELEFDIGQNRDKYGRLLAYVYADGVMIQEELLKKGLARVAYIYDPNTRYVDPFTSLQKQAQEQGIGIWKVENYAQEDGFHEEIVDETEEQGDQNVNQDFSSTCTIKGNIISKDKIYHTTESPWYEQTKEEVLFCSVEEAEEAGFRAPK